MKQINACTVEDVLVKNYGNQSLTARQLGVNRGGLRGLVNNGLHKKLLVQVNDDGSYTLINHVHGMEK